MDDEVDSSDGDLGPPEGEDEGEEGGQFDDGGPEEPEVDLTGVPPADDDDDDDPPPLVPPPLPPQPPPGPPPPQSNEDFVLSFARREVEWLVGRAAMTRFSHGFRSKHITSSVFMTGVIAELMDDERMAYTDVADQGDVRLRAAAETLAVMRMQGERPPADLVARVEQTFPPPVFNPSLIKTLADRGQFAPLTNHLTNGAIVSNALVDSEGYTALGAKRLYLAVLARENVRKAYTTSLSFNKNHELTTRQRDALLLLTHGIFVVTNYGLEKWPGALGRDMIAGLHMAVHAHLRAFAKQGKRREARLKMNAEVVAELISASVIMSRNIGSPPSVTVCALLRYYMERGIAQRASKARPLTGQVGEFTGYYSAHQRGVEVAYEDFHTHITMAHALALAFTVGNMEFDD